MIKGCALFLSVFLAGSSVAIADVGTLAIGNYMPTSSSLSVNLLCTKTQWPTLYPITPGETSYGNAMITYTPSWYGWKFILGDNYCQLTDSAQTSVVSFTITLSPPVVPNSTGTGASGISITNAVIQDAGTTVGIKFICLLNSTSYSMIAISDSAGCGGSTHRTKSIRSK